MHEDVAFVSLPGEKEKCYRFTFSFVKCWNYLSGNNMRYYKWAHIIGMCLLVMNTCTTEHEEDTPGNSHEYLYAPSNLL